MVIDMARYGLTNNESGNYKGVQRCLPALLCTAFILSSVAVTVTTVQQNPESPWVGCVPQSSNVNVTAFWETERVRVESTPLNVQTHNHSEFQYYGRTYNATEISYEMPNFVGASPATFRINATVITPTNASGDVSMMPGVLFFPGLWQHRWTLLYPAVVAAADMNATALIVDHPGHGESEGPPPTPDLMNFTGDFNKTSHFYLIYCNAIQAFRVLQGLAGVDTSRLVVCGTSYGGYTAHFTGAIFPDKVRLVMPLIQMGGLDDLAPESFAWNVLNVSREHSIANDPDKWFYCDPLGFINMPNYPEVWWGIGTADEFYNYELINRTFNTIMDPAGPKWLSIVPNGHHGVDGGWATTFNTLRYAFGLTTPPPTIKIHETKKVMQFGFEGQQVTANVTGTTPVTRVDVCYRYKNIIGDAFKKAPMQQVEGSNGTWTATVNAAWLSSEMEYYIIAYPDIEPGSDGEVFYTTPVHTAGVLVNYLSFLPVLGIIAAIGIPVFFVLKFRHKIEVQDVDERLRAKARVHFIIENALVATTGVLTFASFALTWCIPHRVIPWSMSYIFTNYFTYTAFFGEFAFYFTGLVIALLLVVAVVGVINPLLSAILNISWLVLYNTLLGFIMMMLFNKGSNPDTWGPGLWLFLFAAIGQAGIWAWRLVYRRRLGIKWVNLVVLVKDARAKAK